MKLYRYNSTPVESDLISISKKESHVISIILKDGFIMVVELYKYKKY